MGEPHKEHVANQSYVGRSFKSYRDEHLEE